MSTPPTPGNSSRETDALLARGLTGELSLLKKFVDLLEREQQTLTSGDIQLMLSLVDEKSRLATQLGLSSDQRSSQLTAAGFSPDRTGMENWLGHVATRTPASAISLRNLWSELLTLAGKARTLNETNGRVIGMHLQHNQQALNTLLSVTNQAMLYGPDGQAQATHGGRLFGSA